MLAFEQKVALERSYVGVNHRRPAELSRRDGGDVQVFTAHDPIMFDRAVMRRS